MDQQTNRLPQLFYAVKQADVAFPMALYKSIRSSVAYRYLSITIAATFSHYVGFQFDLKLPFRLLSTSVVLAAFFRHSIFCFPFSTFYFLLFLSALSSCPFGMTL